MTMPSHNLRPFFLSLARSLAFPAALLAASACSSDDPSPQGADAATDAASATDADTTAPDAAPLSPSCQEAANHSDLAWIQENIFTPGCAAFSSCHQGAANQAGGLTLESGQSEAAMLGIASTRFTDWNLVVAGDPAMSYLMVILTGEGGPIEDSVGTMPYNNPKLCEPKIAAIRRWIESL